MLNYLTSKLLFPIIFIGSIGIIILYLIYIIFVFLVYLILSFYYNPHKVMNLMTKLVGLIPKPIPTNKILVDKDVYTKLISTKIEDYFKYKKKYQTNIEN